MIRVLLLPCFSWNMPKKQYLFHDNRPYGIWIARSQLRGGGGTHLCSMTRVLLLPFFHDNRPHGIWTEFPDAGRRGGGGGEEGGAKGRIVRSGSFCCPFFMIIGLMAYELLDPRCGEGEGGAIPTIYVLSRNIKKKYLFFFYLKIFHFLVVKFSLYLYRRVFVKYILTDQGLRCTLMESMNNSECIS